MALPSFKPHNNPLSKHSNFQHLTNPTTLIQSWSSSSSKPNNTLTLISSKFQSLLLHCSTKPDTSSNSNTHHSKQNHDEPNSLSNNSHKESQPQDQNQTFSSSSPSSSTTNTSTSLFSRRGLVFDLGFSNSWDSEDIGSPVVKRFQSDEEERWYIWYHGKPKGKPSSDLIGLAISSNGVHWERGGGPAKSSTDVGFVMNCGNNWWGFDTHGIRPSELVIMSSYRVRGSNPVYWLYYTGYSSESVEFCDQSFKFSFDNPIGLNDEFFCKSKILKSLPGLAISQDGRHWARIEGEHHSGALIDVGDDKDWDSLFISSPQVVYHGNGDLRMYYHSFDLEKGEFGIGIARSRDGIRWLKLGKIMGGGKVGCFDEFGAMNACVTRNKIDGNYMMAYEGVGGDGRRCIGVAVSPDGLKEWVRLQDEAVLKPSDEGCWDDKEVGSPCFVCMDDEENEWRLYYRGVGNGGRVGIGMAVSEGNDVRSFRRWTGFHV
ncbi:uncharacterized protein [Cicer arietinum]|uniref:Uncharacterized protein LOC101507654 n=1 Tax=Cicer arietinum TaxID=3827 RepID=A0A1S2XJ24_CICAR|nr:uncharacterized protein LOC101507654 [Cicer arietinum]